MTMAITAPLAPIHHGAQGGRVSASSQPLNSAEPSSRNALTGLPASRRQSASVATALSDVTRSRNNAGQPNR